MTLSQPNIALDMTSDATFRAWAQAVSNGIAAAGLVKTADTGQVDWTAGTQTRAGASGAVYYEIWRFTDALQATRPVFIKVIYNGNGSTTSGGVLGFQIGYSTNGAGAFTGNYTAVSGQRSTGLSSAVPVQCTFASDGSYLTLALGSAPGGANTCQAILVVDRTRNTDGSANGDGVYCLIGPSPASSASCTLIWAMASAAKTWANGLNVLFPAEQVQNNGLSTTVSTGVVGTDVQVFPHQPFAPYAEAAALGCIGVWVADIPIGTLFAVTLAGATHTYLALGTYVGNMGFSAGGAWLSTHGIAVRAE